MSTRRQWALAGLAGASLAGGAWLGVHRLNSSENSADTAKSPASGSDAGAQNPDKALFQLAFEQPDGGMLTLKNFQGRPLLLNFWATWCPPCIAELPLIERFYTENSAKNWQVIGLAVDQMAAVQKYLKQMPLRFPIGLTGAAGIELSRGLGNLAGGLPYTVVFAADGSVAKRHMGVLSPEHLRGFAAM